MWLCAGVLVGIVFGVLTRLDELTPGFSAGLSTSAAWLGVAFLAGCTRSGLREAAAAGAATLTAANVGYYATDGPYGPVALWFLVALLGGGTAGWTGGLARRRGPVWLVAGALGIAGIAVLEALDARVTVAGLHLP